MQKSKELKAFNRLLHIMDDLRLKCPWDKKQTMESLRHLTIEEVYELGDAILDNDLEEVKKELGDVLLHIVFYAKIGSETNSFDIADVCDSISDKLIDRHPHIYGDVEVSKIKLNSTILYVNTKFSSEKIISKTPKIKNGQDYTEKDLKEFENIVSSKNNKKKTDEKTEVNNVPGKIYDTPKFLPAGDKYMLIEFGNVMNLELNFTAQNLA